MFQIANPLKPVTENIWNPIGVERDDGTQPYT